MVVRLSALSTSHPYHQEIHLVLISVRGCNNLDWGPVPHFCPLEALQPVWLMPKAYCTIPVF
jgi:hypothetical protein